MSVFPIDDFTPEILARILNFASETYDKFGRRRCDTVQLATVCKAWHDLIFSQPVLWNHLYLEFYVGSKKFDCNALIPKLKRWFGRAGTLPLHLNIKFHTAEDDDYSPTPTFLEYLADVRDWETLNLIHVSLVTIPRLLTLAQRMQRTGRSTTWPEMKQLMFRSNPCPFREDPALSRNQPFQVINQKIGPKDCDFKLHMESSIETVSNFLHTHPLLNLTNLTIDTAYREPHPFLPPPVHPFAILLQATKLVKLQIGFGRSLGTSRSGDIGDTMPSCGRPSVAPSSPITVPEKLVLDGTDPGEAFGFQRPTPRRIYNDEDDSDEEFRDKPSVVVDAIVPFVLASRCELENLTLSNLPHITPDNLTNIISNIPPLRRLSLINMVDTSLSWDGDMVMFFEDVREVRELGGDLIPLLEYFHYEADGKKVIANAKAPDARGKKLWSTFKADPVTWCDRDGGGCISKPASGTDSLKDWLNALAYLASTIRIAMPDFVFTGDAIPPLPVFSQATVSKGFVFASGNIGITRDWKLVEGGIKEQTRAALRNLEVVLKAAGSSLQQIVKVNIYITDFALFAEMNEPYAEFFEKDKMPARTCVGVASLPFNAAVEIECTAEIAQ
ncbi:hypothetical protein NMY22_g11724 [Coprinellus aureogranulatus]|nr:hypothetical protein NMY22_g11724 [Coprinellus aureogranulatus]